MKFPVKKESGGYSLGGGRGQSLCVQADLQGVGLDECILPA